MDEHERGIGVALSEGKPEPLGSVFDGRGTNFSVFSSVASGIELCLFDERGVEKRIGLPGRTGSHFHGYLESIGPGQRYGFRVHGPWNPAEGHLSSPQKLLLDPCARAVDGAVRWDAALFPYDANRPEAPVNNDDTASFMPKSVVIDPSFDWKDDRPPKTPLEHTIIYEVHVKGYTINHPEIPPELRGTYAGLGSPAAVEHLTRLGVTAVELLPVQQFIHRRHLVEAGLRNYWGYDPVSFFAPHNEYVSDKSPGGPVREFKEMVRSLHSAGLEVILDVVFNHTGEGGTRGAMLVFKGIDNKTYYRLKNGAALEYEDYTGTQNTVNSESPHVRRMIVDALRYWADEMHVDGFRFDLAPVLAREGDRIDFGNDLLETIRRDPLLGTLKLIVEPWDIGPEGYQLGRFPGGWSEWNDKYRDDARDFWHQRGGDSGRFMTRLGGSPDIFGPSNGSARSSVNYVTCHDGFTLEDLVSYERKHNEANGEANRDGHDDNRSWNCGVEGPTDNIEIKTLRSRQKRNFIATLLLSRGVPMLLGGDELGRTHKGNNNAYCQDNETSWFDWSRADQDLIGFVASLVRLRKQCTSFRHGEWSRQADGADSRVVRVSYDAGDRQILVGFNPTDGDAVFDLPPSDRPWFKIVDTTFSSQPDKADAPPVEKTLTLTPHSLAVLVRPAQK
jgi:glycogen operon protein